MPPGVLWTILAAVFLLVRWTREGSALIDAEKDPTGHALVLAGGYAAIVCGTAAMLLILTHPVE